jgi:hypothetical protein
VSAWCGRCRVQKRRRSSVLQLPTRSPTSSSTSVVDCSFTGKLQANAAPQAKGRFSFRPFCLAVDLQCSAQFSPATDSAGLLKRSALGRRGSTPRAPIVVARFAISIFACSRPTHDNVACPWPELSLLRARFRARFCSGTRSIRHHMPPNHPVDKSVDKMLKIGRGEAPL